jgi:hypothetical protein
MDDADCTRDDGCRIGEMCCLSTGLCDRFDAEVLNAGDFGNGDLGNGDLGSIFLCGEFAECTDALDKKFFLIGLALVSTGFELIEPDFAGDLTCCVAHNECKDCLACLVCISCMIRLVSASSSAIATIRTK